MAKNEAAASRASLMPAWMCRRGHVATMPAPSHAPATDAAISGGVECAALA